MNTKSKLAPHLKNNTWLCAWHEEGDLLGHDFLGRTWVIDEVRQNHRLVDEARLLHPELVEMYGDDYETSMD